MDLTHHDANLVSSKPRALAEWESPRLIIQGKDTKICGPCCVAMALDTSVEIALELMHSHGGGTNTQQLIGALRQWYWTPGGLWRVTKHGPQYPERGILKVVHSKNRSHWVLKWNDFIYDPSWGTFLYESWMGSVRTHTKSKVTSFLKIRDRNYAS